MAGLRGFLASNWQLLLLVLVVFLLWHQPVAMPLRLLVVLFHEASHALAAILTGGRVEALTLNAAEGGHALVAGGNFFVIASAGYLGSLAIGLVILAVSLRTGVDRGALAALGAGILILAALYVREAFALAFCLAVAAAFLAIARYLPAIWSDLVSESGAACVLLTDWGGFIVLTWNLRTRRLPIERMGKSMVSG